MKILFVGKKEKGDANMNIALSLAVQMRRSEDVRFFWYLDSTCHKLDTIGESFAGEDFISKQTILFNSFDRIFDKISKLLFLLKHIFLLGEYIERRKGVYTKESKRIAKQIDVYCKENDIDCVIAVCYPYVLAQALSFTKSPIKKYVLQLDPYTNNYVDKSASIQKRKKIERNVLKKIDAIFTTDIICDELERFNLKNPLVHVIPIEFPEIHEEESKCGSENPLRDSEKIKCMYVGSFYPEIRTPNYLFDLFSRLPKDWELHIAGGGEILLRPLLPLLGNRVVYHGMLSLEEANKLRNEADVLININNAIPNQVPSKIFEYINTGKVMINICQLENCPSIKYSHMYRNAFNIMSGDCEQDTIDAMVSFVNEHKDFPIPHDEVLDIFEKNTIAYVCNQILEEMRSL